MKSNRKLSPFDKHFHYVHSVQSAEHDAELILKMYLKSTNHNFKKNSNLTLLEDFCGTAALCYEWVKLNPSFTAIGIDLDQSALAWGIENHGIEITESQLSRVQTICGDVLLSRALKPDIICALNFSYFFLQTRSGLLEYLKSTYKTLKSGGVAIFDCFGGPEYQLPHIHKRRNKSERFTFWWEIMSFDAISNNIKCQIHFQRDGEEIRKKVFHYDWRLWSVPEMTDLLHEAGFKSVAYWAEGLDKDGSGNGKFKPIKSESDCEAWVCYLVAQK